MCQRWRRIVFASPHTLRLFLSCTSSTPVGRTIDCWPPLPLILRFDSWPSYAPEGDDNIVAALQLHDRIRCIELFLTDSLVEKLNTHVTEPFSELVELFIPSESNKPLILPGPRHWSMHLRILHLKRSFLPSLPVLLSSPQILYVLSSMIFPLGFLHQGCWHMPWMECASSNHFLYIVSTLLPLWMPLCLYHQRDRFSQLSPNFTFKKLLST